MVGGKRLKTSRQSNETHAADRVHASNSPRFVHSPSRDVCSATSKRKYALRPGGGSGFRSIRGQHARPLDNPFAGPWQSRRHRSIRSIFGSRLQFLKRRTRVASESTELPCPNHEMQSRSLFRAHSPSAKKSRSKAVVHTNVALSIRLAHFMNRMQTVNRRWLRHGIVGLRSDQGRRTEATASRFRGISLQRRGSRTEVA